jgi:hypothetical protein
MPRDVPVHTGRLKRDDNVKRGQVTNFDLGGVIKRDLKDWSTTKELAIYRVVWKLSINMPEPYVGCKILWVSHLAYPNLFRTKGFVVVVVICIKRNIF